MVFSTALSEIDLSSPLNYGSETGSTRNTPIRPRPGVRSDRHLRQVNLGSVSEMVRFHGLSLMIWPCMQLLDDCSAVTECSIITYNIITE